MTRLFLKNSSGKVIKTLSGNCKYITVPQDYVEVEYIDNPDNKYLDTGVTAANKLFVMDIQFTSNTNRQLMGISGSSSAYFGNNAGTWEKIGTTGTSYTTLDRVTLCYDVGNITANKTNCWLQGATNKFEGSDANYATASANTLKLFGLAGNSYICKMKLYSLKVYDSNGTLLNYFVPVKYNDEVGIYDLITRVFKKAVSGTFTAGPNAQLPDEYQEVEFIQGTGSQYIAIPNTITCDEFELVTQYTATTSEMCIIGNQAGGNTNRWELFCDSSRPYYNLWTAYNSQGTTAGTISATNKATLNYKYSTNKLVVTDGTNTNTINKTLNEQPRFLFQYGGSSYYSKAKVFKLIFKYKNGLLSKLIPCYRKSDNVIGMYDLINDTFLINSGSGTFTKGDNV